MFSGVFMGFGVFLIFWSKGGGKNFSDTSRRGGANNFRPSIFSESSGKIKGHVKNLLRI